MDVIYGLIPGMLIVGFLAVVVFIYMGKSGQFDDLDGAANSIFMDDEYEEDQQEDAQNKQATTQASLKQESKDASPKS